MIFFFCFLLRFSFNWEDISNTQDSVFPHFHTPWSSSKILHYALYFQLSSRWLKMWFRCDTLLQKQWPNLLGVYRHVTFCQGFWFRAFLEFLNMNFCYILFPFWNFRNVWFKRKHPANLIYMSDKWLSSERNIYLINHLISELKIMESC